MVQSQLTYSDIGRGQPIILIHGLFGSRSNLGACARTLAPHYRVISVDVRNHGESFHHEKMDYPSMAEDIIRLQAHLGLKKPHVLGHSMGGKIAMQCCLSAPQLFGHLIVADIAAVVYQATYLSIAKVLLEIEKKGVDTRKQAEALLLPYVEKAEIRTFLLKNLTRNTHGYGVCLNAEAIVNNYHHILKAPVGNMYDKTALFVRGDQSDFINEDRWLCTKKIFPKATLKVVTDAGHWLHAQQPDTFNQLVTTYLATP